MSDSTQPTTDNTPPIPVNKQTARLPTPAKFLSCLVFNARSLANKLHELQNCLKSSTPSIVCITETWLSSEVSDQSILGGLDYKTFRCDRSNKPGGGVLILTNNQQISSCIPVDLPEKYKQLEIICIDLKGPTVSYRIITCYRKPAPDTNTSSLAETRLMVECLGELCMFDSSIILVGDFNFPNIVWQDGCPVRNNMDAENEDAVSAKNCSELFKQFVSRESLVQLVNEPTRYNTYSSTANTLDLVMSNDTFAVFDLVISAPFANSDHCSLEFKLALNNSSEPVIDSKYDFRNADWDEITSSLSVMNWNDLLEDDCFNISQQFDQFYDVIHEAIDRHVPVISHSNNQSGRPRIPYKLRKLYSKKRSLWRLYKKTRSA